MWVKRQSAHTWGHGRTLMLVMVTHRIGCKLPRDIKCGGCWAAIWRLTHVNGHGNFVPAFSVVQHDYQCRLKLELDNTEIARWQEVSG
jgi:hypothetical protein